MKKAKGYSRTTSIKIIKGWDKTVRGDDGYMLTPPWRLDMRTTTLRLSSLNRPNT